MNKYLKIKNRDVYYCIHGYYPRHFKISSTPVHVYVDIEAVEFNITTAIGKSEDV